MRDLEIIQDEAATIWLDNKSTISMAKNPIFHGRTKHIIVKYHALKKTEANGEGKLKHCKSKDQVVNILTKSLSKAKFEAFKLQMGVVKNLKDEC